MNDTHFINQKKALVRPPVVVVMGHIDHGKTKILDYIRKTKVAEAEAGGITQHIGAYEINQHGKRITFIDTPGHEAFSKMRSRGALIADVAILVVAADEGVKPQTKEAISIIQESKLPFVVALNKIDKPEAEPERVKKELADSDVLIEGWGGQVPIVEVSAKTGQNIDQLLEIILLLAELENLKFHPETHAQGAVIESHVDPRRGITATLIILDGRLGLGDFAAIGRSVEVIKILENFQGEAVSEALASSPVVAAGLSQIPAVGERFVAFPTREGALNFAASLPSAVERIERGETPQPQPSSEYQEAAGEEKISFNIILKTDVVGSREALEDSLLKMSYAKIAPKIIKSEAGEINESDVKLALGSKNVTIVGFKVGIQSSAEGLAKNNKIRIIRGEVIYNILEEIKSRMEEMLPPEIKRVELGKTKIIALFKQNKGKQIVGGKVEEGIIKKGAILEIKRRGSLVGHGKILQLEQQRNPVESAKTGELGIMADADIQIQEQDTLNIYEEENVKQKL